MINIKEAKRHEFFNEKAIPAARQNVYATHSSKVAETYSSFFAICDETRAPLGFNYLCSATCGSDKLDICTYNAAFTNVQAFLNTEVEDKDDKTILQLLQEDDDDLRKEIEEYTDKYEELRKAMLEIPKSPTPTKTDGFLKQVYFPIDDEQYHLLTILPSSPLVAQVNQALKGSSVNKIRNSAMKGNVSVTTGSYMMSKNSMHFCFCSLPPKNAKKTLQKSLKHEYLVPDFDIDELEGVTNGMLIDESFLDVIINEGIRKGTGNQLYGYDQDERKTETTDAFLKKYGYDSRPVGYEYHHIVPIAQSGADAIENLILLSKADHKKVTAKHKEVFKWQKQSI